MSDYHGETARITGELKGEVLITASVTPGKWKVSSLALSQVSVDATDLLAWLRQVGYAVVPVMAAAELDAATKRAEHWWERNRRFDAPSVQISLTTAKALADTLKGDGRGG